ncbi:MAG: hypothetical protein DRO65_00790 [Candidatus Altiarchaeales archaeon]|nr:MAG: hypothetical protein DRO65_00790 [Candidatus Altiarchaeales archaeon]
MKKSSKSVEKESWKKAIKRIRWNVVFGTIFVVLVIIAAVIHFNPFSSGYKGKGDLLLKSWLKPRKVDIRDTSTIYVELFNRGDEKINVKLHLSSRNLEVTFPESNSTSVEKNIRIGAGEKRIITTKILINASYAGSYGIDIKATYNGKVVKDTQFLEVEEKFA